jgi:hypothetical protein
MPDPLHQPVPAPRRRASGGRFALVALGVAAGVVVTALALGVAVSSVRTEREVAAFEARVAALGAARPASPVGADEAFANLPAPVRRYFRFVFRGPVPRYGVVRLEAEGAFRRPRTDTFAPTTAAQVIAIGVPALMFSATTPVLPGVWARAFDFFADGEMRMGARILSTLTVVDERGSPELDRVSLRRWLLESALYPQALLPGGPVAWEPIDDARARAVVEAGGHRAAMVAHFDAEGRMLRMTAEEEGDLSTPYHGSGEHVTRDDYRPIGNQMIPMRFTISRAALGRVLPFWDGRITAITFE